ncbi:MAG TPA: VOC family protein [Acidimicrobiia bacterium]|nr:VOC family protein [Acidimicrobiia bacterium]
MIDHVGIQCADVAGSRSFYEALLARLGMKAAFEPAPDVVGFFGPQPGSFWLSPAERDETREIHVAFRARTRAEVRAFHDAAVALGAEILHAPRVFPEYHPTYYGAFVRDPDGHNVEAVCHEDTDG